MNDPARRLLEGWGCDPHEFERQLNALAELDVELDLATFLLVNLINGKVNNLMADVTALSQQVERVEQVDAEAAQSLGELRDEVAQLEAGEISQETIDNLTSKLSTATDKLAAANPAPPAEEPPVEPPVEEPPAEG